MQRKCWISGAKKDHKKMEGNRFQKIGIVGSGRMGESIFYHISGFDYDLVWKFRKEDLRDKAVKKFNKKVKRMHKAGALDDEAYNDKIDNTFITVDMEALKDCDLIIETIVEDVEKKSALFRELDLIVDKQCVFVSNSSSIKPSKMCPDSPRKDKFAGVHFFYPVKFNTIVEIVGTDACSDSTLDSLKQFTEEIEKRALVLPEKGAFILNTVFIYFQVESFRFYKENVLSFQEIDQLIRKHIFSMGTFEFLDQVGLDVILFATENYMEDMEYPDFIPLVLEEVGKRVDKGNLGIKTGKGFYSYNKEDGQDEINNLKDISGDERKIYEEELVNRLICLYINSAYDYIDKGYCTEEEIEAALSEYKGMEKGPVTLGNEVGFGKVYNLLLRYYEKTGEKIFYPSSSLKKRAEMGKE